MSLNKKAHVPVSALVACIPSSAGRRYVFDDVAPTAEPYVSGPGS